MSGITTHILDVSRGRPAADVHVSLAARGDDGGWDAVAEARTDDDGRAGDFLEGRDSPKSGAYRLRFEVGEYFGEQGIDAFYPYVEVAFTMDDPHEHHHVPLLLSPYGYSTYRGS